MPAHASWRTLVVVSALVLPAGCETSVSARAVWMVAGDDEGSSTIHVYDRGERRELDVIDGDISDYPTLRIDPRGRGVFVRPQEHRAAWIDLVDGRRLPFVLNDLYAGPEFSADGSALLWVEIDPGTTIETLHLLPVAPGLPLVHTDPGGVEELVQPADPQWWVTASDAPVAFIAEYPHFDPHEDVSSHTEVGLWAWPRDPGDPMIVRELATGSRIDPPASPNRVAGCSTADQCISRVALDPAGEVAVFRSGSSHLWYRFDARAPEQDAPLSFPSALDELIEISGIGLIHLIDRDRSVWLSSGLLHWWNQRTGEVRSLPVLGTGPFHVLPIERGHAVLFMSITGQVLRADAEGLRPVSLVTTPCGQAWGSAPVVSPSGRWLAWTCIDAITELELAQETIVRVSPLGLDRFTGVPMTPLAIDDEGHLLLTSEPNVVTDPIDGTTPEAVPRNLYVLSREGVLTRIDELEPEPIQVDTEDQFGAYLQARAI